jgi:hypothetical protein
MTTAGVIFAIASKLKLATVVSCAVTAAGSCVVSGTLHQVALAQHEPVESPLVQCLPKCTDLSATVS